MHKILEAAEATAEQLRTDAGEEARDHVHRVSTAARELLERLGAMHDELGASLPHELASLSRAVPNMYGKAYRWVAEMREIAAFAGDDQATAMIFEGFARLFERLAEDVAGERREVAAMDAFLER